MRRQTSSDTYHAIKDNGLLSDLRFRVYDILYHHGPLTQMESCRKNDEPGIQDRSLMPRFAELERFGVIRAIRERPCSITGRMVLEWDVTDKLPVKFDKEIRHKCKACDGKGYVIEQQSRLF